MPNWQQKSNCQIRSRRNDKQEGELNALSVNKASAFFTKEKRRKPLFMFEKSLHYHYYRVG